MANFKFKARKQNGELVAGSINAANEPGVAAYIREQGLLVAAIQPVKEKTAYFWSSWFVPSITLYDIAIFCRQFSTLVGAGVSLITALDILTEQTENVKFKQVIDTVSAEVHKGSSLSEALSRQPKVFPPLMIHMIQAGETGGILETVLQRLATQYEKDYRLRARLKSALTYPAVVLAFSFIVVGIILTFIMPTFTELFMAMNIPLPWPTRFVMAISDALRNYVVDAFLVVLALVLFFIYRHAEAHSREFCLWRDKFYLRLPVLGSLYNKIIITRFASTFAGLSRSGVPILTALDVVAKATGSLQAEVTLKEAKMNIQRGRGLSQPMERSGLFPPMVINMVAIGEETGSLDYMLDKVAEFYGAEVEDIMGRLQTLLEPLLIVILGVIVGFIAVAMLMPMFDIITKVGNL